MIDSTSKHISLIQNMDLENIPEMNNSILGIYKSFLPAQTNISISPNNLNLKNRCTELKDLKEKLENLEKHDSWHKGLSIALLITTILIITAVVAVAIVAWTHGSVEVAFFSPVIIYLMGIIPGLIANKQNRKLSLSKYQDTETMIPLLDEIIFVYNAYSYKKNIGKRLDDQCQNIVQTMEGMKNIVAHKATIEKGIYRELAQTNIFDVNSNLDLKRIESLRAALKELNKAEIAVNAFAR
jgi:hypothetical protein